MAEHASTFLSAEWRYLAILTWEVEAWLLQPFVPRGTELDLRNGNAQMSLVGFRFLKTRVLGLSVPFHRDFDEVNLRFYVRRETAGEVRRGVVFIRELVPRHLIALVARAAYNEPYLALSMRSETPVAATDATFRVRYEWLMNGRWQGMGLTAAGQPMLPRGRDDITFVADHEWGYTRQRDGSTIEYRVEHPLWSVWEGTKPEISPELSPLYGAALGAVLARPPKSALLADGSPVRVFRPVRCA